jgi:transcriptional regulator with XRE-family HTH domain
MSGLNAKIIGENIKRLREATGLSQHDFSTIADISKRSLANIEYGVTLSKISNLNKLLIVLDIDLSEISKSEIKVPIDFRERLIKKHKKDEKLINILEKQPTVVYGIRYKLLSSDFLNHEREIRDIRNYFKNSFDWNYRGSSLSNALKRMGEIIEIKQHPTKANTNLYSKRR